MASTTSQISLFFASEVQRHEWHWIAQHLLTETIRKGTRHALTVLIYTEHPRSPFPLWLFLNKQFILNSFKFKINISNKTVLHFSSLCVDMYWKRIQMSLSGKDEAINKKHSNNEIFLFLFQHKNIYEWTYHVTLIH